MSTLNIGGDKADASYRYKMPALVTKIEGRGNGIKTVILNMHELAKSLHIHPAYPTKYFGIELGAQSKFSASSDRAVVNGAHQPGDLAKILERFIAQFILCPVCKLPELKMSIKSSIKIDCAACGHNSTIKTTHKLAQYIIKNPPAALIEEEKRVAKDKKKIKVGAAGPEEDDAEEKTADKKKGGKREHKKDKKKRAAEGAEGDDADAAAEDGADADANGANGVEGEEADEEEEVVVVKEKVKKDKKKEKAAPSEEKSAASARPSVKAKHDDDVWYTDTSKEAQQARKEAEFKEQRGAASTTASIEAILASSKLSDSRTESPLTTLKIFLAQGGRSVEDIQSELKRITLAKGLDQPTRIKLLLDALVETDAPKDAKGTAAVFHKHRALLASTVTDRASSLLLIGAVEELLGATHKELIGAVPHVLKQLYDDDVCDEDSLVQWYDSPPESSWRVKKEEAVAVRAKARVFVEWLKNADGDEEDGDDEEEEEEEDGDEDEQK